MTDTCQHLPAPLELTDFDGDWQKYCEALYAIFKNDMLIHKPKYNGKDVDVIHETIFDGKERSFWHIVSHGKDDYNRVPDLERASRIPWLYPFINGGNCSHYLQYSLYHDESKKNRVYLLCEETGYLVVLEDRIKYYKLITAFILDQKRLEKEKKRYKTYIKNENAHP